MPVSFKSSLRCAPIVLCAAGVLALTACGGSSSSGQAASGSSGGPSAPKQNPSTLTIAVTSTPVSINPALNGVGDPLELYSELFARPAYLSEVGRQLCARSGHQVGLRRHRQQDL